MAVESLTQRGDISQILMNINKYADGSAVLNEVCPLTKTVSISMSLLFVKLTQPHHYALQG